MGFSENDDHVRVDFFTSWGKWYTTEEVVWTGKWASPSLIHAEFAKSLRAHFHDNPSRLSSMDAICIEPYHQNAHPIMIKAGGWFEQTKGVA